MHSFLRYFYSTPVPALTRITHYIGISNHVRIQSPHLPTWPNPKQNSTSLFSPQYFYFIYPPISHSIAGRCDDQKCISFPFVFHARSARTFHVRVSGCPPEMHHSHSISLLLYCELRLFVIGLQLEMELFEFDKMKYECDCIATSVTFDQIQQNVFTKEYVWLASYVMEPFLYCSASTWCRIIDAVYVFDITKSKLICASTQSYIVHVMQWKEVDEWPRLHRC